MKKPKGKPLNPKSPLTETEQRGLNIRTERRVAAGEAHQKSYAQGLEEHRKAHSMADKARDADERLKREIIESRGQWGLIDGLSSTGPVHAYYFAKSGYAFHALPSDEARRALELIVPSQRAELSPGSESGKLVALGGLEDNHHVHFVDRRPAGQPAHSQVVSFTTGEKLG